MTSTETALVGYVVQSALDVPGDDYMTRSLGRRSGLATVEAAKADADVHIDRLRTFGYYAEGTHWQDADGEDGCVATRILSVRPDRSRPQPGRLGRITGTITQRVVALRTTGATDGSMTALDFVRRYLDEASREDHRIHSVACALPNPEGKTDDDTCPPCEAQRILAEAAGE